MKEGIQFQPAPDNQPEIHAGVHRSKIFADMPEALEGELYNLLSRSNRFSNANGAKALLYGLQDEEGRDLRILLDPGNSTDALISSTLKLLNQTGNLGGFLDRLNSQMAPENYDRKVLARVRAGLMAPDQFQVTDDPDPSRQEVVDFGDEITSENIRRNGVNADAVQKLSKYAVFHDRRELKKFFDDNLSLKPFYNQLNQSGNSVTNEITFTLVSLLTMRHIEKGSLLEIFLKDLKERGKLYEIASKKK